MQSGSGLKQIIQSNRIQFESTEMIFLYRLTHKRGTWHRTVCKCVNLSFNTLLLIWESEKHVGG